ncbi:unnamed protein product [Pocillopora meandrina]|uniref:Uncharacterized protein n=1 Tax=Pocillopora meandrina TaxID=46732 RepID=A0AAU9X7G9_9CNID|nr:unnamed protein product [Pocillopora meandrina]
MTKVCSKLEMFGSQQILPFMMNNLVCSLLNSCGSQTISSAALQPSYFCGNIISSCGVYFKGDTSISPSAQSDLHEVIDLSTLQPDNTPATSTPVSVELSGLQIYKTDVASVRPNTMITDTIVFFFIFVSLPQCMYPIVSTNF